MEHEKTSVGIFALLYLALFLCLRQTARTVKERFRTRRARVGGGIGRLYRKGPVRLLRDALSAGRCGRQRGCMG